MGLWMNPVNFSSLTQKPLIRHGGVRCCMGVLWWRMVDGWREMWRAGNAQHQ